MEQKTGKPEKSQPQENSVKDSEPSLIIKAMMEMYPRLTRKEVEELLDGS